MDCQVQTLYVKFGQIKEAFEPTPKVPITTVLIDNDITTHASSFPTFKNNYKVTKHYVIKV